MKRSEVAHVAEGSKPVIKLLAACASRWRLYRCLRFSLRSAGLFGAASLVLVVATKILGTLWLPEWAFVLGSLGFGVLMGLLVSLIPIDVSRMAVHLDIALGLENRLCTAFGLIRAPRESSMASLQIMDAGAVTRNVDWAACSRLFHLDRKSILLSTLCLAPLAAIPLPTRGGSRLDEEGAFQPIVGAQQIERLAKEWVATSELAKREDVLKKSDRLLRLSEDLRRGALSREEAVRAVSLAAEELRDERDRLAGQEAMARTAAEQGPLKSACEALAKKDMEGFKKASESLKGDMLQGSLSDDSREAMVASLREAASQMRQGSSQSDQARLTAALVSLGDDAKAAESLDSWVEGMCSEETSLTSEDIADALERMENCQEGLSSGEKGSPCQCGCKSECECASDGSCSCSQGACSCSGGKAAQRAGKGGSTSGLGDSHGSTPGVGSTNLESAPFEVQSDPLQGRQSDDRSVREEEFLRLYKAKRVDVDSKESLIPGTRTGSQTVGKVVERAPAQEGVTAQTPYQEIFSSAKGEADAAIRKRAIPPSYEPVVRRYFDEVQP